MRTPRAKRYGHRAAVGVQRPISLRYVASDATCRQVYCGARFCQRKHIFPRILLTLVSLFGSLVRRFLPLVLSRIELSLPVCVDGSIIRRAGGT